MISMCRLVGRQRKGDSFGVTCLIDWLRATNRALGSFYQSIPKIAVILIPIRGDKSNPSHLPLAFLGQCLVVTIVIVLFVLYVSGLRI
jgi:hypothetical protein